MEYRNPKYNHDGSIDCEINHPQFGWIPFTARADDCEEHGRIIFAEIEKNGEILEYQPPPPPTSEQLAENARIKRNNLLIDSDWSQLPDVPESIKSKWTKYRQALRDITNQKDFPDKIKWPEKPEE